MKLFESVREVKNVKVYDIYFDSSNLEVLVEYLVKCKLGEISAKIIYSYNPQSNTWQVLQA